MYLASRRGFGAYANTAIFSCVMAVYESRCGITGQVTAKEKSVR